MKVCIVARRFYESNSHMQQFAKALSIRGHSVDVVCARRPGLPIYEECGGVNIYRIRERSVDEGGPLKYLIKVILFIIHATIFVAKNHLRRRYDLVHVQSIPDLLVFSALGPKLLGTPVILDLRDLVPELYVSKFRVHEQSFLIRLLALIEKASCAFADHVIVANPIWYDRVIKRSAASSKCSMIWYSPDPTIFYARPRKRLDGKFLMMYPGTLSWHQGLDIAIRAMPNIAKEIPQAELHIYADRVTREPLVQLARQVGAEDTVQFFDFVPLVNLVERMADCDVGIVPKRASDRFGNEAASTKIPEFMAMGIPVVASRTAIESQLFTDSDLCYFRSEDEDDFVRAVVSIYRDPALRDRLVANGIKTAARDALSLGDGYLLLANLLLRQNGRSGSGEGIVRT